MKLSLVTIGLYNMFKNPQGSISQKTKLFSEFLSEVDNGRVVKVEIQEKNIKGVLSNVNQFTICSRGSEFNSKLSEKGVSISASPLEEKMPSLIGTAFMVSNAFINCSVDLFYETNAGEGGAMGSTDQKPK